MTDQHHTPEPWTVSGLPEQYAEAINADGPVCICRLPRDHAAVAEVDANARRIVAAVNACQGIPTDALEAGAVPDLLAACERGLATLEHIARVAPREDRLGIKAILRAAIAKTREGGTD